MKKSTYKYKASPPLGELTDSVHINVDEIPDHVRDELAAAVLDMVRGILAQPGGREMLDAKIRERAERSTGHLAYIQRKPGGKVWITEHLARATHPVKPEHRIIQNIYRQRRV